MMIFFFFAKLTDLLEGDDPRVHVRPHFGELLQQFGGDVASGYLFMWVLYVAQIWFQVEAYVDINYTDTQIENGHFVTCVGAYV